MTEIEELLEAAVEFGHRGHSLEGMRPLLDSLAARGVPTDLLHGTELAEGAVARLRSRGYRGHVGRIEDLDLEAASIDLILILVGAFTDGEGRLVRTWEHVPETTASSDRAGQLRTRMDHIDRQLTELQGVMIDLSEKLDRRQYGQLL